MFNCFQGNAYEKENALTLICQLSFVNSNKQAILDNVEIEKFLKSMAKDKENK